jgi:ribose/xylose/arabinose/galactoside ABC-type transport system permease subunit
LGLAGPFLGLLLVVLLFCLLIWLKLGPAGVGRFLSVSNLRVLVVQAAIPTTVALGMTMIMISGGIDLSVGYVVSLVTVTTTLTYGWAAAHPGLAQTASLWAMAAGLGTGLLAGLANGLMIARLKVVPFVVTLGTMGIARGLAQYLAKGETVTFPEEAQPPVWVPWLGAIEPAQSWLGIGPSVWTVLIFALLVAILLKFTLLGRYCYALGSNEATARLCGIHVERVKIIIYTLAGIITGWGGILQVARSGNGDHKVGAGMELDVIAAVVIGGGSLTGGEGTVTGTLVGSLMIGVLSNGCSKFQLSSEVRFIIIGLIIVVVSALNTWRQQRVTQ